MILSPDGIFFCLCRFVKGIPVLSALLPDELIRAVAMEPTPKGISYIINTKVLDSDSDNIKVCLFIHQ